MEQAEQWREYLDYKKRVEKRRFVSSIGNYGFCRCYFMGACSCFTSSFYFGDLLFLTNREQKLRKMI